MNKINGYSTVYSDFDDIIEECNHHELFEIITMYPFKSVVYIDVVWYRTELARKLKYALITSKEGGIGIHLENGVNMEIIMFEEDAANSIDGALGKKYKDSLTKKDDLDSLYVYEDKALFDDWMYVYEDLALYEDLTCCADLWFYQDYRKVGKLQDFIVISFFSNGYFFLYFVPFI
jgi:hypothetical protein